jgi:hypothetical protein
MPTLAKPTDGRRPVTGAPARSNMVIVRRTLSPRVRSITDGSATIDATGTGVTASVTQASVPPWLAVITVVPTRTPVTRPPITAAVSGFALCHDTVRPASALPLASRSTAARSITSPTTTDGDDGAIVILATEPGAVESPHAPIVTSTSIGRMVARANAWMSAGRMRGAGGRVERGASHRGSGSARGYRPRAPYARVRHRGVLPASERRVARRRCDRRHGRYPSDRAPRSRRDPFTTKGTPCGVPSVVASRGSRGGDRTRDLTIMSRALSPAELPCPGVHRTGRRVQNRRCVGP